MSPLPPHRPHRARASETFLRLTDAAAASTDFVCCNLFNTSRPPPKDWRKRYPASAPGIKATGRNDTVPAANVTACIHICTQLYYTEGCRAAAWNGPQKQCYLKSGKANLHHKPGDISFLLGV